ncbi:hypothetical protein N0V88_000059 [Collariella sp. IMI 366227]|nr:hypothetical protein N0V88_000059 [Collariella sp. IMI 366227]
MLPGPLVSVYQQYKKDTDSVASWLASTARAWGYPADLLSSGSWNAPSAPARPGRLKGKERKEACKKEAAAKPKYIVALVDFLPLAKFIAGSRRPPVSVPDSFSTTIDRLIKLRADFATRLADHGAEPDAAADARHHYFVGVLTEVRDTLRPRMSSTAAGSATFNDAEVRADKSLTNRFAALNLFEPSGNFPNAQSADRPQPVAEDKTIYEAEPQTSLEDAIFAMSTLVDDLSDIRTVIKWVWHNYGAGNIDLAAAAVATNAAIELARGLIEDLNPVFKDQEGVYQGLGACFLVCCRVKGYSMEQSIRITTGKDAYDNTSYGIADNLCITAYHAISGYLGHMSPDHLGMMTEGSYDADSYQLPKTGDQMAEDDHFLIEEFLDELMVIIRVIPGYPVEDTFLRGLKEMDKTGEVPFYLVFAAQVFLDIHHTLRSKIELGAAKMLHETSIMCQELQAYFEFHKKLKTDRWPEDKEQSILYLSNDMRWITKDPVHQQRVHVMKKNGVEVPPSVTPHHILKRSPVLAGLLLFHFRFKTFKVGIAVADAWGSIRSTMYLYHALRTQKLLRGAWRDIEVAHSLLGDSSFFVGGPPRTLNDHVKKYFIQMGVTISFFINPKHRRQKNLASRAGPRYIKEGLPVSTMFAQRDLGGAGKMDWTAEHIDTILARSEFEVEILEQQELFKVSQMGEEKKLRKKNAAAAATAKKGEETSKTLPISSKRLVKSLVIVLEAEAMKMAFPYLTLHRSCWGVLRAVNSSCEKVLQKVGMPAYIERESQLPWVVGSLLMDACGSGERPTARELLTLQAAAAALNGLLGTGDLTVAVETLRKMGSRLWFEKGKEEGNEGKSGKEDEESETGSGINICFWFKAKEDTYQSANSLRIPSRHARAMQAPNRLTNLLMPAPPVILCTVREGRYLGQRAAVGDVREQEADEAAAGANFLVAQGVEGVVLEDGVVFVDDEAAEAEDA